VVVIHSCLKTAPARSAYSVAVFTVSTGPTTSRIFPFFSEKRRLATRTHRGGGGRGAGDRGAGGRGAGGRGAGGRGAGDRGAGGRGAGGRGAGGRGANGCGAGGRHQQWLRRLWLRRRRRRWTRRRWSRRPENSGSRTLCILRPFRKTERSSPEKRSWRRHLGCGRRRRCCCAIGYVECRRPSGRPRDLPRSRDDLARRTCRPAEAMSPILPRNQNEVLRKGGAGAGIWALGGRPRSLPRSRDDLARRTCRPAEAISPISPISSRNQNEVLRKAGAVAGIRAWAAVHGVSRGRVTTWPAERADLRKRSLRSRTKCPGKAAGAGIWAVGRPCEGDLAAKPERKRKAGAGSRAVGGAAVAARYQGCRLPPSIRPSAGGPSCDDLAITSAERPALRSRARRGSCSPVWQRPVPDMTRWHQVRRRGGPR